MLTQIMHTSQNATHTALNMAYCHEAQFQLSTTSGYMSVFNFVLGGDGGPIDAFKKRPTHLEYIYIYIRTR